MITFKKVLDVTQDGLLRMIQASLALFPDLKISPLPSGIELRDKNDKLLGDVWYNLPGEGELLPTVRISDAGSNSPMFPDLADCIKTALEAK